MTKPQVILDEKGQPAYADIPWHLYKRFSELISDLNLSDEELYDNAGSADEESFPIDVADRLLAGENTVKVYRVHRGKTQKQLAQEVGINTGHVYLFVQTDIAVIILVTVKEIKLDSRFWFKGDIICESQASV